jgi:hypothetical protein
MVHINLKTANDISEDSAQRANESGQGDKVKNAKRMGQKVKGKTKGENP